MKMTKINIFALAAGALLTVNPVLRAQDAPPKTDAKPTAPHSNNVDRLGRLAEELKLTDDQKSKVGAAISSFGKSVRDVHQDNTLSEAQKREKRAALQEELKSKMKAILTPEQFEKWQKLGHMQRPPAPPAGAVAPKPEAPKN